MGDENNKKPFEKVLDKIKNNKLLQYGLIIFIILAVFFVIFLSQVKKDVSSQNKTEMEIYISSLENKLSSVLSEVEGAGNVKVIITIDGGKETILASKITTTETANGKEIVESPILVNGKTVVLKELYPKIKGVLIVSEGANNLMVLNKIQQATISLLNVSVNQVEILKMK